MKLDKFTKSSCQLLGLCFVALLGITMLGAGPAEAKTLKAITCFPTTHLFSKGGIGLFQKNLEAISGGKLSLAVSGPEVIPTNEQFQPVQAGVFDILYTHPAYHLGATAMGLTTEALSPDPQKRRSSGVLAAIDKSYEKLGMKLIAVLPALEYNIVLKKPIGDRKPSLNGLKIRTAPSIAPLIKALGGAPVSMPPGEIYTALQKGVIDGFTLLAVGLLDYKIYEVAKYLVRPKFGFISASIYMNLDKYNSLTDQEKAWINQAALKTETDTLAFFRQKHEAEVKKLKELGMKEIQLRPEDAAKAGPIFMATIWAVAEKKSGQSAKDLHKLAKEKGLTK